MRALLCALLLVACGTTKALEAIPSRDPIMEALQTLSPATLPLPPPDVTNRYADDARAAELGRRFFFDPGFSGALIDGDNDGSEGTLGRKGETGRVACASCHVPEGAFADTRTRGHQISLGAGWGKRRAPSLLDVGQATLLMWDGSFDTLYNQVFGPIESAFEMNTSRLFVAEQIGDRYKAAYEEIFGALPDFTDITRFPRLTPATTGCKTARAGQPACPGAPGDGAQYDSMAEADRESVTRVVVNFGKAIGAYERQLRCGPGRFDAWMHGDPNALSVSEQNGAKIFAGKGECISCHSGPFFSDQKFHNVGLAPALVAVAFVDLDDHGARDGLRAAIASPLSSRSAFSDGDDGRLAIELDDALDGAFRTPTLRCVSRRSTFFHTGQIGSLADAVHFSVAPREGVYPGVRETHPIDLTADEEADLVAFLRSLDGL